MCSWYHEWSPWRSCYIMDTLKGMFTHWPYGLLPFFSKLWLPTKVMYKRYKCFNVQSKYVCVWTFSKEVNSYLIWSLGRPLCWYFPSLTFVRDWIFSAARKFYIIWSIPQATINLILPFLDLCAWLMNRFNSRGRKQGHQSSSNTDTCEVLVVDIGKPLGVPAEEHGHGDRNNVVVLPSFFLLCWKAFVASSNGMGTYHVFHWDI